MPVALSLMRTSLGPGGGVREGFAVWGKDGSGAGTGTSSTARVKLGPSFMTTPALHVLGSSTVRGESAIVVVSVYDILNLVIQRECSELRRVHSVERRWYGISARGPRNVVTNGYEGAG